MHKFYFINPVGVEACQRPGTRKTGVNMEGIPESDVQRIREINCLWWVTHASSSEMLFSGKNGHSWGECVRGHMRVLQEERDSALAWRQQGKEEGSEGGKRRERSTRSSKCCGRGLFYDPEHPAPPTPQADLCPRSYSASENLVTHRYNPVGFNNHPQGSRCLHFKCQT